MSRLRLWFAWLPPSFDMLAMIVICLAIVVVIVQAYRMTRAERPAVADHPPLLAEPPSKTLTPTLISPLPAQQIKPAPWAAGTWEKDAAAYLFLHTTPSKEPR